MPADNIFVSCAFGALLVLLGGGLCIWHRREWNLRRRDPAIDAAERRHLGRQFRRRIQVALLIVAVGVVIPAGDVWLTARKDPRAFAWYVALILLLSAWMAALAMIDLLASRLWNRRLKTSLAQLERKRRELQAEADRLRRLRGNGPRSGGSPPAND